MSDGTVLRGDVWLPATTARVPTLLQRLPYDKSSPFMTQHIVGLEILRAVDAGFAVVIQDVRGRFRSEGAFTPFLHERDDGLDTVAWIRAQDFSDGTVSMFGASYLGTTQALCAAASPEGLVAVAPQLTPADIPAELIRNNGAFQLGTFLLWIIEALAGPDAARAPEPQRARAEEVLRRALDDPEAFFVRLPVDNDDLHVIAPYARDCLTRPPGDAYWDQARYADQLAQADVAGLHIAGLHDIFLEGGLRLYRGLRDNAPTRRARESQHLLLGPWSHANLTDWQGDHWYGYAAALPAAALTEHHLDFFRAAHAGRPSGLPPVRRFVTGVDTWRDEESWPPPGTREHRLFLHSGGSAGTQPGDGRLSATAPGPDEPPDTYRSDPRDPVPTVGGCTFLPGYLQGRNSGPKDQAVVEARTDVLVYTTAPLDRPLEVAGEVLLELFASSDARDCDWTGKLTDVAPDGRSLSVNDGVLRSRSRPGPRRGEPLVPGRPELFTFGIGSASHVFRAGHRIRLQVASSNFPRFDVHPQDFVEIASARAEHRRVALQSVFHDALRPSALVLPVVGGA